MIIISITQLVVVYQQNNEEVLLLQKCKLKHQYKPYTYHKLNVCQSTKGNTKGNIKRGNTGQYQALYDVHAFVIYNPVKHRGIIPVYTPYPPTFSREEIIWRNPPPSKIQHFPSILENPDIGLSMYSSPGCVQEVCQSIYL